MTTFHQGPADGKILVLSRAPKFLRVVVDKGGKIDALDQLDDQPKITESIHVYQLEGEVGRCHILTRGKGGHGSGWRVIAKYRFFPDQPADSEIRKTAAWRDWTRKTAALKP